MVESASGTSVVKSALGAGDASKAESNDPLATHEAGIYLYQEKDGQKKMIQLEPSISKQMKTGGIFSSAMTLRDCQIKTKAALRDQLRRFKSTDLVRSFYFYFEVKKRRSE